MPVATAEQFWIALRASRLFGANRIEDLLESRMPTDLRQLWIEEKPGFPVVAAANGLIQPSQRIISVAGYGMDLSGEQRTFGYQIHPSNDLIVQLAPGFRGLTLTGHQ